MSNVIMDIGSKKKRHPAGAAFFLLTERVATSSYLSLVQNMPVDGYKQDKP